MKRALITTLLLVGSLHLALAQDRALAPPMMVVTGTAEERVAPDNATVRLGVVARAPTAAAAQEAANVIMQRLLQRVEALKIDRKSVQTSNLMLNPVYVAGTQGEQLRIVAYEARNVVSVNVSDLTLIGKVIDAGVAAGANNVEGVFFGLRDDKSARLSALRKAVANAREKAEAMASALGVTLGGVYEISEGGAYIPPMPMYDMRAAGFGGAEKTATSVEPGEVTVNGSVTIRFFINQR